MPTRGDHRVRKPAVAVVLLIGRPCQRPPGHPAGGERVGGAVTGEHRGIADLMGHGADLQGWVLSPSTTAPAPAAPAVHDPLAARQEAEPPGGSLNPMASCGSATGRAHIGHRSPEGPGLCRPRGWATVSSTPSVIRRGPVGTTPHRAPRDRVRRTSAGEAAALLDRLAFDHRRREHAEPVRQTPPRPPICPSGHRHDRKVGSGAGGHVGGEDVVGVSVQVVPRAVVAYMVVRGRRAGRRRSCAPKPALESPDAGYLAPVARAMSEQNSCRFSTHELALGEVLAAVSGNLRT